MIYYKAVVSFYLMFTKNVKNEILHNHNIVTVAIIMYTLEPTETESLFNMQYAGWIA